MHISLRRTLPGALAALLLLPAAAASAAGTIQLTSDRFETREGDSNAAITVSRSDTSQRAEIRYGVWTNHDATAFQDYQPVTGRLDFAPGQAQAAFHVPVVDDSLVEEPETVKVGIYGPYGATLAEPTRALLTIQDDDSLAGDRDPANPLLLDPAPTSGNPLQGARFFVDRQWGLVQQVIKGLRRRNPAAAAKLDVIAEQPETKRFGTWTKDPRHEIATFLQRVQATDPGAVPLAATYRLRHLTCGGISDSPADADSYKRWYDQFAAGIGNQPIVLFYEIDALITSRCLSTAGLNRRTEELRYAIDVLSRLPHAVVYVDAGSGLAHAPRYIAWMLRRIGVAKIQGFFTNATHQDRTLREIAYGRTLMRMLGGTPHQIVNTSSNGRGPLVPHDRVAHGNSLRCNAPGRGLGPRPTSDVPARLRNVDGFIWIGNPGRSAGNCQGSSGAPPVGTFWLRYALELIDHANFGIS